LKIKAKTITVAIPLRESSSRSGSHRLEAFSASRSTGGSTSAQAASSASSPAPTRKLADQPVRPASQTISPPAVSMAMRYMVIRTEFATPSSRVVVDWMV
jgi:hypothetical protein